MEKAQGKYRDIKFFSEKNQELVCVHSREAREYADQLEQAPNVVKYQVCKELDEARYQYINPIDIRKDYFAVAWTTDFVLHFSDGSMGIREVVAKDDLLKRAVIEKLEFSRRYWATLDARDWKMVIIERGSDYVL